MKTIEGEAELISIAELPKISEEVLEGNRVIVRAILQYQLDMSPEDAYVLLESADQEIAKGDDTPDGEHVEPHYNALMVCTAKDEARQIINDLAKFGYKVIKTEEKNVEYIQEI